MVELVAPEKSLRACWNCLLSLSMELEVHRTLDMDVRFRVGIGPSQSGMETETSGEGALELVWKAASSTPETLELKLEAEMESSPAACKERV